jgi:ATP-binding cassette subfamily B protein
VVSLVLVLISGLLPVLFIVVTGLVVGAVPAAVSGGLDSPAGRHLLESLAILAVVYLAETSISSIVSVVTGSLGSRFTLALRTELLSSTLGPAGIAHLEDATIADELRVIGGEEHRWYAENLMYFLAQIVTQKLTGLGSVIVLATMLWWAPLTLIPALYFFYRWLTAEIDTVMAAYIGGTPELRRANYLRDVAIKAEASKEIRVFGLSTWLINWYGKTWLQGMEPQWEARRGHSRPLIVAIICELVAGVAVFGIFVNAAFTGDVSIGQLAVLSGTFSAAHSIGPAGDNDMSLMRGFKIVKRLFALRKLTRTPAADLRGETEIDRAGTVRFEDVTFAYPTTSSNILEQLTLEIPHGHSLAIVGLNGAGKTTLTKLLARLYDPDAGRITVDGVDIREIDPRSWRRRIGVIFQDFVRFELDARANIGFGAPHLLGDDAALLRASDKAGATAIVQALPDGWDTTLSRGYDNGTELSGGQWQRVAIARALMALEGGADILVLDEPTANLDVRAEAELFDRFLEITAGATTILISHRFSTVRRADRIAVIEHGQVLEQGTHDELIAVDGRYAHLFRLQAERFTEETTDA